MSRYGTGMRNCCDSVNREGYPHIVGCRHYSPPFPTVENTMTESNVSDERLAEYAALLPDDEPHADELASMARELQSLRAAAIREEAAIFGKMDGAFEATKERVTRQCGQGDGIAFYVIEQVAITLGEAKKAIRAAGTADTGEEKE